MKDDFLIQLQRLINHLEKVEYPNAIGLEENMFARIDRALLAILHAEHDFVKGNNQNSISVPSVRNSVTGFPSLPSLLADMRRICGENSEIRALLDGCVVKESRSHCAHNLKAGARVIFSNLITHEKVQMREEGISLKVSVIQMIDCDDSKFIACGKHPEVADGLEKILATRRYQWLWNEEQLCIN